MVTSLLFGVACHGGTDEPLNIHLKRITDSAYTRKTLGGADIDGEFIAPVIQESHDSDCRREIMRYLRTCLSEPSGRRWQRIYGGLALTEKLMEHGSPALAIEVAHGHHFDLVQKVSFLEFFDAEARGCADRRAQNVVRTKAKELLAILVPLLEKASTEELPRNAGLNCRDGLSCKDTASTCSKDTPPTSAGSTAVSSMSTIGGRSPISSIADADSMSEARIDDAFSELRGWMESADFSSGASCNVSPRGSGDESDWEPIGRLPVQTNRQQSGGRSASKTDIGRPASNDASDTFFTPRPAPAVAPAPTKTKFMMSL